MVQGGVQSPVLFNSYLAEFPTPPPNIKLIKYADGTTINISGQVVADLINGLNIYLSQVLNYKKLTVSAAIFTVTFFMPDTHEHHIHPQVKQADQVLHQKKSKCVRSDARHTSHFHTTLQQYRSKSAATQQCVKSTGRLYLGLRQRNIDNDLPGNWPLNTQLLLPCLASIT